MKIIKKPKSDSLGETTEPTVLKQRVLLRREHNLQKKQLKTNINPLQELFI